MTYPSNLKYTSEHFWVRLEANNVATIGVTRYHIDYHGDCGLFSFQTEAGETLTQNERFAVAGYMYGNKVLHGLPVSGTILEVNPLINKDRNAINQDPHGLAWLLKIQLTQPSELNAFMDATQYTAAIRR